MIEKHVIDALDVETTLLAQSEQEARDLGIEMMKSFGFKDVDVVFVEHNGFAARIRLRAYIYRPGDQYDWVDRSDGK
ncbi:MAG: hypothetical protein ACK4E2_02325 [Pseudothermotoga sp.]